MDINTHTLKRIGARRYLSVLLLTVIALVVLSVILLASVPPVSRDALTHHLAVPKLYLTHGAMVEIPEIKFSYYPMNLDLLYLIPLYLKNDIVPKYIHFCFALLTAILIFNYLKKRIDIRYALLGVVLFLSLPIIIKLSITVYVDLGLVFSTASLISFLKWAEYRFKTRYIVTSAIWCGLALGTKYNALIVLFLLASFVPLVYARYQKKTPVVWLKALAYGGVFAAVALIVFSPWMIRNYVWTRNPVYPLFQQVFQQQRASFQESPALERELNSTGRTQVRQKTEKYKLGHFSLRSLAYNESWWQIALIPLRIFFQGEDDNPQYFDGRLNPFLFLLPLFAFAGRRDDSGILKTEKMIMLWFSILFVVFAFVRVDMRIRYVAPIIPPLVILSVFGVLRVNAIIDAHCSRYMATAARAGGALVLAALLFLNAGYIVRQFDHVRPFDYLSGRTGRDAYIEKYRGAYPLFQYANQQLDPDARILCLFLGNRTYYSDRATIYSVRVFKRAVGDPVLPEGIRQRLQEAGISHLLIRIDLFSQWLSDNFDAHDRKRIEHFFQRHTTLLFHKYVYGLFALR